MQLCQGPHDLQLCNPSLSSAEEAAPRPTFNPGPDFRDRLITLLGPKDGVRGLQTPAQLFAGPCKQGVVELEAHRGGGVALP